MMGFGVNIEKNLEMQKDVTMALNEINFDWKKFTPVLVQFKSSKTNKYSGRTYVYQAPVVYDHKIGELVIAPVWFEDQFAVGIIVATFDNLLSNENVEAVEEAVEIASENNGKLRQLAQVLGTEKQGLLSQYFDSLAKEKEREVLLKQLEEESKKAEKINLYRSLAENNPQMKELLDKLESL